MTTKGAIKFFRTAVRLAELLGIDKVAVYSWGKYPPELRQRQIAELSGGRLKIEPDLVKQEVVEDYS